MLRDAFPHTFSQSLLLSHFPSLFFFMMLHCFSHSLYILNPNTYSHISIYNPPNFPWPHITFQHCSVSHFLLLTHVSKDCSLNYTLCWLTFNSCICLWYFSGKIAINSSYDFHMAICNQLFFLYITAQLRNVTRLFFHLNSLSSLTPHIPGSYTFVHNNVLMSPLWAFIPFSVT